MDSLGNSAELVVPQNRISVEEVSYITKEKEEEKEYPYIRIYNIGAAEEAIHIKKLCARGQDKNNDLPLYATQMVEGNLKEKEICKITMNLQILQDLFYINEDLELTLVFEDKEVPVRFDNEDMILEFIG